MTHTRIKVRMTSKRLIATLWVLSILVTFTVGCIMMKIDAKSKNQPKYGATINPSPLKFRKAKVADKKLDIKKKKGGK